MKNNAGIGSGQLTVVAARQFVLAGNATLTAVSTRTGARYTYKIQAPMNAERTARDTSARVRFVKVLSGADNEADYTFLGTIFDGLDYRHGARKSRIAADAPSAKAWDWVWRTLRGGVDDPRLELWHVGSCGRCGRTLTVPESVATGFGEECAGRLGVPYGVAALPITPQDPPRPPTRPGPAAPAADELPWSNVHGAPPPDDSWPTDDDVPTHAGDPGQGPASAGAPAGAPPAGGPPITISAAGPGLLRIAFPYDPELVATVELITGRRYDPATKSWTVPTTELAAVRAAFPTAALSGQLGVAEAAANQAAERAAQAREAALTGLLVEFERVKATLAQPLYRHQDEGIRYLLEHQRAIIGDDMGLGKTREALVACRVLGHRVIVIAPAGLRINWVREAEAVDVAIEVYSWAKIPPAIPGEYSLIVDEAHYGQNLKAQRTQKFIRLSAAAKAVYLLSGTPIKNGRPCNFFPLLVAINHALAQSKKHYDEYYCAAKATRWSKWDISGAAHLEELHVRTKDVLLRRLKSQCLDLPAKTRVKRRVDLSSQAQAAYDAVLAQLQADYQGRVARGEIKSEGEALVMLGHLRHAGSLAKVDAAVELAEEVIEQGGQVVLFTAYQDSAHAICRALDAHGVGLITGEQSAEQRQSSIDRFQAGHGLKAIVATLGAGNVGITLTAAQTAILVDRPWTPGDALQAEDRLHRIGQQGNVLAIWLQVSGIDAAIDTLLEEKHEKIELVLSGRRRTLSESTSMVQLAATILAGGSAGSLAGRPRQAAAPQEVHP